MQPANIAIALRRRTPWEAIDLGLSMLQQWRRAVYAPHLVVAGVVTAVALLAGWLLERPWVAIMLIWWLKPVYDRVVLHVLSRAVFGERQATRAVLANWREWLGTGLFMALTFGRVDLARSFNLPVRQLEGQTGRAGRERRSVLGRRARGYAVWLTVVCMHFEWVLYTMLGGLAELALPAKAAEGRAGQDLWELLASGGFFTYGGAIGYAVAVMLLEPFYVAAGFGLYLNRRTLLEGWDIEVALRRLSERLGAAALVLVAVLALGHPQPGNAQEKDPKKEIAEVLKSKDFGYEREGMRWQAKNPADPKKRERSEREGWGGIGYAIARVLEVLLWVAVGLILAYALWFLARMIPRGREPAPEPYRPPAALFGLELAPETLPPDVAAAAAGLAREGRLREALGLLYRGSLSVLVHQRGVQLLASHTEAEVLALSDSDVHGYLDTLIGVWRLCAYAKRDPAVGDIEHLAQGYRAAFAGAAAAATT